MKKLVTFLVLGGVVFTLANFFKFKGPKMDQPVSLPTVGQSFSGYVVKELPPSDFTGDFPEFGGLTVSRRVLVENTHVKKDRLGWTGWSRETIRPSSAKRDTFAVGDTLRTKHWGTTVVDSVYTKLIASYVIPFDEALKVEKTVRVRLQDGSHKEFIASARHYWR